MRPTTKAKQFQIAMETLRELLPKYAEIEHILKGEPEAAYILRLAIANAAKDYDALEEEAGYLVQALSEKCWERIHTGHFAKDVPLAVRQIYALACFLKIFHLLHDSEEPSQVEQCGSILDGALLVGCTDGLYPRSAELQRALVQYFDLQLGDTLAAPLPTIEQMSRALCHCDVPQIDRPSVDVFRRDHFSRRRPALVLNSIAHWPAMSKWRDLNYLHRLAGNRTVPIEIGSNYATDEWSQQLVKVRDFLQRQFGAGPNAPATDIEYLAQHELFEQIPALRADICVPDYCTLSEEAAVAPTVDIKAWLGPAGTISPLHYDPKHNLLCQVFGRKQIILAADSDTPLLYPHDSEFLANTSRIDADQLDFERFPLLRQVRFLQLTLQPGDCLYIPPKWWHYVRAEAPTFSVSFWWE